MLKCSTLSILNEQKNVQQNHWQAVKAGTTSPVRSAEVHATRVSSGKTVEIILPKRAGHAIARSSMVEVDRGAPPGNLDKNEYPHSTVT